MGQDSLNVPWTLRVELEACRKPRTRLAEVKRWFKSLLWASWAALGYPMGSLWQDLWCLLCAFATSHSVGFCLDSVPLWLELRIGLEKSLEDFSRRIVRCPDIVVAVALDAMPHGVGHLG